MQNISLLQTKLLPLKSLEANNGQICGLPPNPKTIDDIHLSRLKKSLQQDPQMLSLRELLVYPCNGKNIVIGGNQRLLAIRGLSIKQIPCKVIPSNTTVEQLRAYLIKDNLEYGEWVDKMLASDWDMEELDDFGMDDVDRLDSVDCSSIGEQEQKQTEQLAEIAIGRKHLMLSIQDVSMFKEFALNYFGSRGTYSGIITELLA